MATIPKTILDLLTNSKTAAFARSLQHSDLPAGWADDPEIVDLAAKAWQEAGTDSPFFKAWFGNSKIVDDAGKPKKFYHGYAAETPFDAFDTTKGKVPYAGAFLVDNFFDAASWAKANADGGKKPFVHGGYVKADRPVTLLSYKDADELVKNKYGSDISEHMFGGDEITPDYLWNSLSDSVTFLPDADSANRAASEIGKQMGKKTFSYEEPYDRIIPTHFLYDLYGDPFSKYNDTTDLFSSWVNRLGLGEGVTFKQMQDITGWRDRYPDVMTFFKPENFKSTGNRGTFNPSDPNIYRTLAPLGVGTAAMAASLLAGGDEAKAAAINAALADPASREKAAAAGLPYDPPPTEPVVSPIDILVAPVGAGAGITNKLLAMALEAPVALGLDASLSALGGLFGGGDRKKPGGW